MNEAGFDYVHVLTDEKATKVRIEELMVDIVPGLVDQNDRFLFYWSGHGTQRRIGSLEKGYLPLANSRRDRFSTMVSMDDVKRWDGLLGVEQALFLLDACFSGLAGAASKGDTRNATIDQLAKPSHELITAGTGQEETIASDRWGGSIFTNAVLRAARGAADAQTEYAPDGVVSISELLDYVRKRVAIEKEEAGYTKAITPQRRDLRTSDGEFFFVTTDRKLAKFTVQGADYHGRFEHGMPVVIMSPEKPEDSGAAMALGDPQPDFQVWSVIQDRTNAIDFQTFIDTFPDSVLVPFARNRLAKLGGQMVKEPATPTPSSLEPKPSHAVAERQSNVKPEEMSFSDARVENEFFVFEDNSVATIQFGVINVKFLFRPKQDIKVLLANDWLWIDDGVGNKYGHFNPMGFPIFFKRCEYKSNSCLEKDFKFYEQDKDVELWFKIMALDFDYYRNNDKPTEFKFVFKFLLFHPDGNVVQPVAIKAPLRGRASVGGQWGD